MHKKKILNKLLLFLITVPVLLFIYLPILWLFFSSLSNPVELLTIPPHWVPQNPTLQNYIDIFRPSLAASAVPKTFAASMINSLKVSTSVTVICLILGGLAAYALARIRFKGKDQVLVGILGTRMIPEISLVIPLFLLASQLKMTNTPQVLIITYMSFALPFAIWMLTTFFQTIPIELEEAARLDGCNRIQTLLRVILPVSAPGLITTGLFVFMLAWDEFFYALIFTSTLAAKTVPVAISEFVGRYVVNITGMMAGGILAAVPPVLLALLFQRYIVRGLTAGSVKG
jgi:multiple sugar transport system permease protein